MGTQLELELLLNLDCSGSSGIFYGLFVLNHLLVIRSDASRSKHNSLNTFRF